MCNMKSGFTLGSTSKKQPYDSMWEVGGGPTLRVRHMVLAIKQSSIPFQK